MLKRPVQLGQGLKFSSNFVLAGLAVRDVRIQEAGGPHRVICDEEAPNPKEDVFFCVYLLGGRNPMEIPFFFTFLGGGP